MEHRTAPSSALSEVQSRLTPFIKSRKEASDIRRCLRIYVESQVEVYNGGSSTLSIPGTRRLAGGIPEEVTGLRKKYLKALRTHDSAQEEYQRLCRESTSNSELHASGEDACDSTPHALQAYLDLQSQQRKHGKLQILHDYLERISRKAPASSTYLDGDQIFQDITPPMEPSEETLLAPVDDGSERLASVDGLIGRLERAVLSSQHALERERRFLAKSEARRVASQSHLETSEVGPSKSELEALNRTRDELIQWVETELEGGSAAADVERQGSRAHSESVPVEHLLREVRTRYQKYLEARESAACALNSFNGFIQDPASTYRPAGGIEGSTTPRAEGVLSHQISIYLSRQLIPLSQIQKGLVLQKAHLSDCLSSTDSSLKNRLDRLAGESHLLPAYPLLVGQPRFKNAAAVLASRAADRAGFLENVSKQRNGEDNIQKARAWAFAATAADSTTGTHLEIKLDHGKEWTERASDIVDELRAILAGQSDDHGVVGSDNTEEDVWAVSAPPNLESNNGHPNRKLARHQRSQIEGLGPWKGFDGQIGVIRKAL
ncbi:MAG: carbamoyl-phosphate synthase (glutamine-hydrolyzing) cpa2 [Chaenotheca gracillima]|nr:MAG: carbamoyl-phosphate synthase (glutamine-hydrolyzing) cpa2 [Chaenotheca gracillima]